MKYRLSLVLIASAALVAGGAETQFSPIPSAGQTFIHDPSTIVRDGPDYHVFGTGPGIRAKASSDLIHWTNEDSIFPATPAWTTNFVPSFRGYFWAPDVVHVHGSFYLYYACSAWQKQTSVIGLATSATLDPASANYRWQDVGAVIASTNGSAYNTIDPSAFLDRDGKLWLAFGSYWNGIYLTELDPQTGLRLSSNSPLYHLAWNDSIEASCLTRHDNFYYLFVNWGQCCRGTNSTYEVRVGRAEKITGPYLDRDGRDLADGGGSPFLKSSGRFIGPGHIGIVDAEGKDDTAWFSYHYYDAETQGRSRLAVGKIDWSTGWPVPSR
jgi:arabinan endo-1,5-alpha-L-arabinosidase